MSGPANVGMREELTSYAAFSGSASLGSQPTTNNSRWCKVSDWAKAHKKELYIAAAIIGIIAGVAITGGGGMLLVTVILTLTKVAAVTAGVVSIASVGMIVPFVAGLFLMMSGPFFMGISYAYLMGIGVAHGNKRT